MKSPSDAGLYIITLGMLRVQSNYIQLQNTIRHVPLGPCSKTLVIRSIKSSEESHVFH